jgi:hypothetical protein
MTGKTGMTELGREPGSGSNNQFGGVELGAKLLPQAEGFLWLILLAGLKSTRLIGLLPVAYSLPIAYCLLPIAYCLS